MNVAAAPPPPPHLLISNHVSLRPRRLQLLFLSAAKHYGFWFDWLTPWAVEGSLSAKSCSALFGWSGKHAGPCCCFCIVWGPRHQRWTPPCLLQMFREVKQKTKGLSWANISRLLLGKNILILSIMFWSYVQGSGGLGTVVLTPRISSEFTCQPVAHWWFRTPVELYGPEDRGIFWRRSEVFQFSRLGPKSDPSQTTCFRSLDFHIPSDCDDPLDEYLNSLKSLKTERDEIFSAVLLMVQFSCSPIDHLCEWSDEQIFIARSTSPLITVTRGCHPIKTHSSFHVYWSPNDYRHTPLPSSYTVTDGLLAQLVIPV